MRGRNVVLSFFLVLCLVPCFATSSEQLTKRKLLTYEQIAAYGVVAAGTNALVSTIIATYYADLVRITNPNALNGHSARDVLELVDAKINKELTSRGLSQVDLDELD